MSLTKSEPSRLQYVTARESSLFIFHALGKVLYSKRAFVSSQPSGFLLCNP